MFRAFLHATLALLIVVGASNAINAQDHRQDNERAMAAYKAGDYPKAFKVWKNLAEQGNAAAQYNLGLMYLEGKGVAQNDAQAAIWTRKAAEQGHPGAQKTLSH